MNSIRRPFYTEAPPMAVQGPAVRGSLGSGHTAPRVSTSGQASNLPGYVTEQTGVTAESLSYSPPNNPQFMRAIARSIASGDDGLLALNPTYRAHDFVIGTRFLTNVRSAPNWQEVAYPPDFRTILEWRQPGIYRVQSTSFTPRYVPRADYFAQTMTDPATAAHLGASALGTLGG